MSLKTLHTAFRKYILSSKSPPADLMTTKLSEAVVALIESIQALRDELKELKSEYTEDKRKWALESDVKRLKHRINSLENKQN